MLLHFIFQSLTIAWKSEAPNEKKKDLFHSISIFHFSIVILCYCSHPMCMQCANTWIVQINRFYLCYWKWLFMLMFYSDCVLLPVAVFLCIVQCSVLNLRIACCMVQSSVVQNKKIIVETKSIERKYFRWHLNS